MKKPWAVYFNLFFRTLVAIIYIALGYFVAFESDFDLGYLGDETPVKFLLGILFIVYGLFRLWRAYVYYKNSNENEYGTYSDEE
ncbi:hypothetical protein [Sandaracinomonas limnophila]|uniref:hypothetical protein n=1 Tax=Sandaracinomonas limnophila TaxID=1862386 RepID=UPI0013E2D22D|nr:hypothetical protein [Sandaracinomonas limnophila]